VRREAQRCGIRLRLGVRVAALEEGALWLEGEDAALPCDLAVWATGAAPTPLLAASDLPRDARGFLRVGSTLEVVGCEGLFAAGDCAALDDAPWLPRAGVYAVREGPVLDANLRARLSGRRLRRYRPQRDFLALLNLGEGSAVGSKWGAAFGGRWVWHWKDRIDRRFMRRFRVLDAEGAPAAHFPGPESMGGDEEMVCGGCAAKLGASELGDALARLGTPAGDASVRLGLEAPDDAALLDLPRGDRLLATIDAFRAFTDDPWLVGRVAAVNAASDVLATGGRPRHALALVTVPEEDPRRAEETLYQVLAGIRAGLEPLGTALVGGHTTKGPELFVGLTVTGELAAGEEPITLAGARPGDALVLTKALGTGVLLAADMRGLAKGVWMEETFASMLRANDAAANVARECGATSCTDVSGFGLAGHLTALLRASGVAATLSPEALPALPGGAGLLERGMRSTFHDQNARLRADVAIPAALARRAAVELLFDPQTSGGLLFTLSPERAAEALRRLRQGGDRQAAAIGVVEERGDDVAWIRLAAGR
jgi:selenide,water dikinase